MNKYEFVCQYCGNTWQSNYIPQDIFYCTKCKDSNIRIINLQKSKVDYYAGAPEFQDEDDRNWNF